MTRYHVITDAKTGQTQSIAYSPDEEGAADAAEIPTVEMVHGERERRIALPLAVTLAVGTIEINMDAPSQRNIQGLASVGQYLAVANPSQTTNFRAYDNNTYSLTPADLVGMGLQVAARIQACYAAEWALKAMSPIPSDFTDDQYWP